MDEQAQEEIIKRVNPKRGFESEVDRVLSQNKSLSKSDSWDGPTDEQFRELRNRISTDETTDAAKFKRNNKTYIRVGEDNYKKATRNDDVLVTDKGRVFLRDEKGRAKELVK